MADGIALGKQIGPLPMGGWAAIIAGGLAVGYFINKKAAKNAAPTTVPAVADSGVGVGGTGGFTDVNPPAPTTPGDTVAVQTNQAWGLQALNWLIAQKYDPGTADNAIRKYLYGQNLTIEEQALINQVLLHFGAPPEPLPPVVIPTIPPPHPHPIPEPVPVPTPAPKPKPVPVPVPPPPPAPRTYTIVHGDTLSGISVRYYGSPGRWIDIYNTNSGAIEDAARSHGKSSSRGPNGTVGWWIYPGTTLRIP